MSEITCEEYARVWTPRIRSAEVVAVAGSTNFMDNGIVETTWAWADDPDRDCLRDEVLYGPGGWPNPDEIESCRHWVLEDGDG